MRRTSGEFLRYGAASLATYAWMFGGTYAFTQWAGLPATWSYAIVTTTTYIATYFLNVLYVFKAQMTPRTVRRFLVHASLFWALNNAAYATLYHLTSIHYLVLVVINVAVFTAMRFFSLKWFVFRSQTGQSA